MSSNLCILHSARTDYFKPRFGRFRLRKGVKNVRLHAGHYQFSYALITQRRISDKETVIISGKISIVPLQVTLIGKSGKQELPPPWGYKGGIGKIRQDIDIILIGEAQRRR